MSIAWSRAVAVRGSMPPLSPLGRPGYQKPSDRRAIDGDILFGRAGQPPRPLLLDRMRVLFTTRGSSGHVGPLAPFAQACLRAGHEVLVSAQRQFGGDVERLGLPLAPVDEPSQDEWMPLIGGFAELDMESAHRVMIEEFFAGLDVRAELPALGDLVERWRPDVIVRESWEFGSELLAERHGIPILRVGLGLAATEAETIETRRACREQGTRGVRAATG